MIADFALLLANALFIKHKKLTGFLIAFFSIAFIVLIILKVWNVAFIGWADVLRSGVTLALLASIVVILLVVNFFFFKRNPAGKQ